LGSSTTLSGTSYIILCISILLCGMPLFSQTEEIGDVSPEPTEESSALFTPDESTLTFSDSSASGEDASPTSIGSLIQAIISLGVVLLLILGVLYGIRRLGRNKAASSVISVITTQSIQNNKNLFVVSIADMMYFMASSEAGIQLISEIQDEDTKNYIRTNAQTDPGKTFGSLLSRYFPGKGNKPDIHAQMQVLRNHTERLKKQ